MKEIWKEIPRYIQCEVSNLGHVRYKENVHIHGLAKRVRPLKLGGFGYHQVTINNKTESVHNLVAEAFIGPRPAEGNHVDHINEDKLDNRPENLRWITHSHNTWRASNVGDRRFFYPGELWLIKKLLAARIPYVTIGKMFKCSSFLISEIKKGKKDNHLRDVDGNVIWEAL